MDIKNKVFIVTGGASGLGAGTAKMLCANGGRVILADVQDEAGTALASESLRRLKLSVKTERTLWICSKRSSQSI